MSDARRGEKIVIMENETSEISSSSHAGALTPTNKVLIVDDESIIRNSLKQFCEKEGFTALTASSGIKALKVVEEESPGTVILDVHLPDTNGLELLKTIKTTIPGVAAILITGVADLHSAIEAMKMGALDYLEKPIDFNSLRKILNTLKTSVLPQDNMSFKEDFVCASSSMKEICRITASLASKSDITVLVLGESGTGKSSLCKKIHALSPREHAPFVEIGCSNIPEHLIESELFGFEKGAFTDAKTDKKGLIDMANGGTVLLEEIGDMPYQMQSKILDLIERKRFRRIGGLHYINADVRILAATNRDLHDLVQTKRFRLDLFYRLTVATIVIPPLRERTEDLPLLAGYYLNHYTDKYGSGPKTITQKALDILQRYSWPGNVRELKNLVERLVILSKKDTISSDDLPPDFFAKKFKSPSPEGLDPDDALPGEYASLSLKAMETEFIKTALKLVDGNQRKAARLLDVSRDKLRYRLKKLKIEEQEQ